MRIYFVRHGSYFLDVLNEDGKEQIRQVAQFLKTQNLDKNKLCLLTSHRYRAVESAVIIQEIMELPYFAEVDWLTENYGGDIPECIDKFFKDNPNIQIIIAVSHSPEIDYSIRRYNNILEVKSYPKLENGSVNLVDLETKQVQEVFQPKLSNS